MSRITEALKHTDVAVPDRERLLEKRLNPDSLGAFPAGTAVEASHELVAGPAAETSATAHTLGDFPRAEEDARWPPASTAAPVPVPPAPGEVRLQVMSSRKPDPAFAERLMIDQKVPAVAIEQYRRMAGVLHQLQTERGTRVLMIASAQAGDGKSLTAVNLALTLSESYRRRVLLVDADLRRPTLDRIFAVGTGPGLSEGLRGGHTSVVSAIPLSPYLSFLPGGLPDPDPMASLTSGKIRGILEEAAASFDWVIVDTPPVCLLPDAHLLSAMVEVVVLVVGAGVTPLALVERAIEIIGRERIVGVVLNRVERDGMADIHYGNYSGHYNYGYSPSKAPKRGWLATRLQETFGKRPLPSAGRGDAVAADTKRADPEP